MCKVKLQLYYCTYKNHNIVVHYGDPGEEWYG